MFKYKYFLSFEKEEAWLRKMAEQGYEFTAKNFFGGYGFRQAQPKDTVFRIDYRQFKSRSDYQDYLTLFEDSGWKHIAGSKGSGIQYFRQSNPGADDDIFSDQASKAGRYKRLSSVWLSLACCYLPLAVVMLSNRQDIVLYLTPGLWDKTGFEFWTAFLFETPFALMRALSWVLFPLLIGLYLLFAIRAYVTYQRQLR